MLPSFRPFVGNGNGNSFLVVSDAFCRSNPARLLLDLWRQHRVDSVLILAPTGHGDICMLVPGADGLSGRESGEFCGNGSRLVAKFFHESTGRHPVIVSRSGERFPANVSGDEIQVVFPHPETRDGVVLAGGEPHQPAPRPMVHDDLVRFCNHRTPRVSASYVRRHSSRRLEVRTFEHSINRFTASCGTGAVSMAYLFHERGLIDANATVVCPGGPLHLQFLRREVIMSGPAEIDYELEI